MEKFFWADAIAERIIKSRDKKKKYTCAAGIGVSGTLHIGNFRDAITTDLVVKALEDKGVVARFIYSWDNYDRFRKVPKNVPKTHERYLGIPVSEVPAPKGKGNYSDYFEKPFEGSLKKVGINPEFISQSEMNKKCKYAKLIKLAIDKRKEIIEILDKYRKEPLKEDWYPVTVYCEKCKKDSTKVLGVEDYEIEYECECGFKSKFDFRKKGIVKLKWRTDWPARWLYEGVVFEPGGADISAAGGSYITGREISKQIFDYEAPIYQVYEWIKIKGGKEFSGSAGDALTVDDVLEVYEPEILRYLFVGTKPKSAFQISFDNDVIKIYDDYDALEEKYYSDKANAQEKRIYELSQVGEVAKKKPNKENFRHLITLVQIGQAKGKRAENVKNWLEKYAGEDMKFEVQENVNVKLSKEEKEALIKLKEVLKKQNLTEKKLFNEFYGICESVGIKNTEFFDAAYRVIIGKKKGPRLASLILAVGKGKIVRLLEEVK